jgi:ABC-2 type transport system permease protein
MNKTRALYKAFSSNLEMPKPNGEKKVKLYNRFGMIAFIGIMLPVAVIVGYMTYALTNFLYMFDGNAYGLLAELDLISAFAMIFGMPLMFSVLYFSSDLQFLTALPISTTSLYVARFWHTYKAENVMTSNVLFAIYIGYFAAVIQNAGIFAVLNPVAILSSLVGFFGSLLLPLL